MAAAVVVDTAPNDVETEDDDEERLETEPGDDDQQDGPTDDDDDDDDSPPSDLPFPLYASKAFYLLDQKTAPRRWCLQLITSPYPFHH